MQLVVPIAVTAADAAAIKILSRISPHDVFFILLHSLICQFVHRDMDHGVGSSDHLIDNLVNHITKHIKIKGKITHFATNLLILQQLLKKFRKFGERPCS